MGIFQLSFLKHAPASVLDRNIPLDLEATRAPRRQRLMNRHIHVPVEIVLCIIQEAYKTETLEPNYGFLRNCTLVCKNWSFLAQKLLFRDVSLRNEAAVASFWRAVDPSSDHGRVLGDCVVRLRIVMDFKDPDYVSHASFSHVIARCVNLFELHLDLYGLHPDHARGDGRGLLPSTAFGEDSLRVLRNGPPISSLRIGNWSDDPHVLPQLLSVWPSLKSLAINGTLPRLPSKSTPPPPCALQQLRINFQYPATPEFMHWLLHSSADTLRKLELEREASAAMLWSLLSAHGNNLHSIALSACPTDEHVQAIEQCPNLRELQVESQHVPPVLFKRLPLRVHHIAFSIGRNSVLNTILDMVRSREGLRAITVHVWDEAKHHPQLPKLQIACTCRGIDLRITRDIRMFRTLVRGGTISSASYPRVVSPEISEYSRCGSPQPGWATPPRFHSTPIF